MNKKFTEAQIIDGLKNNDSQTFRYLFDEFYKPLLYFTEKIISEHQEAQDIVIQVFHSFWKMRNNFESVVNIKAFLYISCRNRCFNYLKYRQRESTNKVEYSKSLSKLENQEETEHLIIMADLLFKIYREAEKLPEKCRKVFFLTYFEGMKANEIAALLNVSVSNVTSQRARAIQLLKLSLTSNELQAFFLLMATAYAQSQVAPQNYF